MHATPRATSPGESVSESEEETEARSTCSACRRPEGWCYCAHVTPTRTRTRVVVLQHPREARVPLGTLRMVELSLPEAIVRRGVDFADDPVVAELTAQDPPPYVLYPGPEARDLEELEEAGAITLIAIDGTWAQARSILRRNPALAALPRVAFKPGAPSAYRIRRQPAEHCVSTIEALARALDLLERSEGESAPRFDDVLLRPFHALVEAQLRCTRERKHYRTRRRRVPADRPPPRDSDLRLRAEWDRLVCVQGEANDWPATLEDRPEPEIVQWRAHRLATGETFSACVRPQGVFNQNTARYAEVAPELLLEGSSWEAFTEDWRAFLRPDDVLAVWGHFHASVATRQGLPLPDERIDARVAASRKLGRRPGTVERCAQTFGLSVPATSQGRCARRMKHLEAVTRHLSEEAESAPR